MDAISTSHVTDPARMLPDYPRTLDPAFHVQHETGPEGHFAMLDELANALRAVDFTHPLVREWDMYQDLMAEAFHNNTNCSPFFQTLRRRFFDIHHDLANALSEYCPSYLQLQFGIDDGYYLCIDFDAVEMDLFDGELVESDDPDEHDAVLHVNERGNTTFYSGGKEVWALA